MTTFADELNNLSSATVQGALTRTCVVCHAEPGEVCHSLIAGQDGLPGPRLVHYARTGR